MAKVPAKPLSGKERKHLADMALLGAMAKARQISIVHAHLDAAMESLRSFQGCWSHYSQDPQLAEMHEDIRLVSRKIGTDWEYLHEILILLSDMSMDDIEYQNPRYEDELLLRELGIDYDDEEPLDEMPFIEPLEMYKRTRAK